MDSAGHVVLDYDLATPMMLVRLFPSGMLGLGLTALLASFMSGMAGNVTAFNTVWTYDIYQSHIRRGASDAHYLWMGRVATVGGILLAVAAAYVAGAFNNIMDLLQLVFAFVNAPLFATFALGMFWRRTTGHGAFTGLLAGTLGAAVHHGLTLPAGVGVGVKGGYLGLIHTYPSELAQTFWTAIVAWVTCFVVTIVVSLLTRARDPEELRGLVYSMTPKPREEHLPLAGTAVGARCGGARADPGPQPGLLLGGSMSGAGGLDIRLPIGGLFVVLGLILVGYGVATNADAAQYERSMSVNINLWWGLVMLVFGGLMLLLARSSSRDASAAHSAGETPEGLATEDREHQLGLEG